LGGEQVEGRRAIIELLAAGHRRVREILVADGLEPSAELDEIARLASRNGVRVSIVSHRRLDATARTMVHQGVVAMAAPLRPADLDDLCSPSDKEGAEPPFLLVLDGVTDPQNLGALMRTADCAGMTGVVLGRHRAAHVTPSVTKAAAGAIEHLRIAVVPGIPAALARMATLGVKCIGLDPRGTESLYDLDSKNELDDIEGGLALVLGDEGRGLGALTRRRCAVLVSIPVRGAIESLNVSAAGAVAAYELARLRGTGF
jgi:23S rRNA (guanosine2251-2'-O)-methyltransferase